ncbi:hypothetical protein [Rhodococcus sp. BE178]|uniref:hypothetical protein n=1 Tax=Rhodococcus sp. BE178 TaxID=2817737 RepID=UPI003D2072CB
MSYELKPCSTCGEPLRKLYAAAKESIAWGHTSYPAADMCRYRRPDNTWPTPKETP